MPPHTIQVKVRFPSELDAGKLRLCKAVVGISLPTPGRSQVSSVFITEEFLKALLSKAQRSFQECQLMLGDLLQAHNVQLLYPEYDELRCQMEAEELGNQWREQNKDSLHNLKKPLVRWRALLEDPDLAAKVHEVYAVYDSLSEEGTSLRKVIDATADKFVERYYKEVTNVDEVAHVPIIDEKERTRVKKSSVMYIKEELAHLIAYAIKNRTDYFLYPGDEADCPAFTEARRIFLTGENKDLLQWMKVTFRPPKCKLSGRKLVTVATAAADSSSSHDSGSDAEADDSSAVTKPPAESGEIASLRKQIARLEKEVKAVHALLIAVVSSSPPPLVALPLRKSSSTSAFRFSMGARPPQTQKPDGDEGDPRSPVPDV